ncbi:MAG: hypothetical protein AB1710_03440 [Pseudomonadota bacterium]
MKTFWLAGLLAACGILAGCEEKPYQPPLPHTDKEQPGAKLLQPQREALDKAKEMQQRLDGQAEDQRKKAEETSR